MFRMFESLLADNFGAVKDRNLTISHHPYHDVNNIVQDIKKGDADFKFLIDYMELRDYKIQDLPNHIINDVNEIIMHNFKFSCNAVFHISRAIQLERRIYTNKLTGNELYVNDCGDMIPMNEFLKLFDSIRKAFTD